MGDPLAKAAMMQERGSKIAILEVGIGRGNGSKVPVVASLADSSDQKTTGIMSAEVAKPWSRNIATEGPA